ncbi:MAG: glycosyltransferase family 2 protein [Limisphaerales bacterium]
MKRIKTIDIELSRPFTPVRGVEGYLNVRALLRWRGQPVETVTIPITNGECSARDFDSALTGTIRMKVLAVVLRSHLPNLGERTMANLLREQPARSEGRRLPSISVAVCTRDRADDLRACLTALTDLEEPPMEVIVVDNAPRTNATREVVEALQRSPMRGGTRFRYILEPKPGLDWARNRAIEEACGEIVAYTDDDVIVDRQWTIAIARAFAENADVMAMTGLVEPHELETEAQILFEDLGGFSRGYNRRWYHTDAGELIGGVHGGAGKFGTGANMAFRRCLFQKIGTFDPSLDVGTPTRGGGDLEMFFRVLKTGHTLLYEPGAMVRHRHRISYGALYAQIRNNGVGFFSYVTRCLREYPEERRGFLKLSWWFFWWWNIRRCFWGLFHPGKAPLELYRAELAGSVSGLFQYSRAREATSKHGPVDAWKPPLPTHKPIAENIVQRKNGIAVRTIDIKNGLSELPGVQEYSSVRLYVLWDGSPVGSVEIENKFHQISAAEVGDYVVQYLFVQVLQAQQKVTEEELVTKFEQALRSFLRIQNSREVEPELAPMLISVVVATYDRPDELRLCLASLSQQQTRHGVEIVVVDNHPQSGLTPPVVADFPDVKFITERRGGLSFARNAGFRASRGDVLVATDDDVTMPPDWLEKLATPFAQSDVMMVTGAVFPFELETDSQIQFETYGGLGRGFERRRFDRDWFDAYGRRAVPTWEIGATANAAVRASALRHPQIGYLDEALGAGTPTGCAEDTYLFYRVLKAGYAIHYEPSAFVWHRHRRDAKALWKQIYAYSKGHAAYHVVTFLHDGDRRALTRLFAEVPLYLSQCLRSWVFGYRKYPLSLILAQIWGHIVGPFSLWQSRRRVERLNRENVEHREPEGMMPPTPLAVKI